MYSFDETTGLIRVTTLKLASWLRLHGHSICSREIRPDGRLDYTFKIQASTVALVKIWSARSLEVRCYDKFATIVSTEIRLAVRKRRESGLKLNRTGAARGQEIPSVDAPPIT